MNIDDYIVTGIFRFEEEARERYEDPSDADVVWDIAERVAESIHKDVETLSTATDGVTWAELRAAMEARDLAEDLDFALQARLAYHFGPSYKDVTSRCWHLAELLRAGEQPESVKRFPSRISRCYLLGLTPETLVMCRGALENGVNARFAVERESFPKDANGRPSMRARLKHAEAKRWLRTVSASDLYSEVWLRGSTAVHADPHAVGDSLGAVRLTIAALNDLGPTTATPDGF